MEGAERIADRIWGSTTLIQRGFRIQGKKTFPHLATREKSRGDGSFIKGASGSRNPSERKEKTKKLVLLVMETENSGWKRLGKQGYRIRG